MTAKSRVVVRRQRRKDTMGRFPKTRCGVNPSAPRHKCRGLLGIDPERRFQTPPSKAGLGAVERVDAPFPLFPAFFSAIMTDGIENFLHLWSVMDTVEHFSDFLAKIGSPNFLALGIAAVIIWLLISGIRRGWKKGRRKDDGREKDGGDNQKIA
jgi:hypothetical protein